MAYETSNPRTGSRALQMGTDRYDFYYTLGSAISQGRINCQFYYNGGGGGLGEPELFYFRTSATEKLRIKYDIDNDTWLVWAGTAGTELVSQATALSSPGWHRICVDIKLHATAGWAYLYVDDTEVIGFDGKTDHDGTTFEDFGVGPITGTRRWGAGELIDDVTFEDTSGEASPADMVDRRYYWLIPDGAGTYTDWAPSAGDNYAAVDEIPPDDDTTYVESNTLGHQDSYSLDDYTVPNGRTVAAFIPLAVAKKAVAGARNLKVFTRAQSTDLAGGDQTLGTSYESYWTRQTAPPGGGDFTQAIVNALEGGVEVV